MILLDTNALIWLEQGHARVRKLAGGARRLYISPVSLLELQVLQVAHAQLRGWRLATGDAELLDRLSPRERFEV